MTTLEASPEVIDLREPQFIDLRVLRTRLNALSPEDIFQFCIDVTTSRSGPYVIASQNMHGVHTYLTDQAFAALHEHPRTLVHIDGTPLLWLGRMKGYELSGRHRTGCIDWIPDLLDLAIVRGWKVFYLGSTDEVCERGSLELLDRHPGLDLRTRNGYFDAAPDSPENWRVVHEINDYAPDILLVGMGMGRQERWIHDNIEVLDAQVVITTGAMMDLVAGELRMAPRWLGPLGLEWMFRLWDDAPRVAHRYLVEPWLILYRLARGAGRRPSS
ncbi:MAG: WecB/TagA/CpsF family glycosyltransferase [Acidimicrobiales bacterium]